MSRRLLWSTLAITVAAVAGIAACTDLTSTSVERSAGRNQADLRQSLLLDNASKAYKLAEKTRKTTLASLVKDDSRKFNVTTFSANVGKKTKARMKGQDGKTAETDVLETTATCKATVGDEPAHDVAFVERITPVMSDFNNECLVTDTTSGNSRTYHSDQEFQRFTVSDGGQELAIVTNPDGTYTVNGQPAATPAAAAKLIVATPLGKGTSVHSLAAIYGTVLQRRQSVQTLIPSGGNCVGPDCNGPTDDPGDLILAVIDALNK